MITYNFDHVEGSLYEYIYKCVKNDIISGKISAGEKLPSKRNFAKNNGVSTITIQNAYDQLAGEGYIIAIPKKGYYAANIEGISKVNVAQQVSLNIQLPKEEPEYIFDFSSNRTEADNFPFSIWSKLLREVISVREKMLLEVSPAAGVFELRQAIANHLNSFRGMNVDPNQIVVGAGTDYLYGLLVKLLGKDRTYCIESPGYRKLQMIYDDEKVVNRYARMDEKGIRIDELRRVGAEIAHISPTHHFPTGITMPISRRYEVLAWANESAKRYIIEDDYDSEFRLNGKPIPALQSIDASGKVIYMNTFSKSLAPTIRISYMVLPEKLANKFYRQLAFYSCTVSTFEQYTLAAFISKGYFEKHINRMRLHYGRKRAQILGVIKSVFREEECKVLENDSGLHFLLQMNTKKSDHEIRDLMIKHRIKITPITDYDMSDNYEDRHQFILNYSSMDVEGLEQALMVLKSVI